MSIIGIIPARGGSKGIYRKNLVSLVGCPLIRYTIEAAHGALSIDRVLVSTDDPEIVEVVKALGAEVPFIRPAYLASDEAPILDVLTHMLVWLEDSGEKVEAVVLLQPTSPLRTSDHIDEAIAIFRSSKASSVVSVIEVPHQFNPVSVMSLSNQGFLAPFLVDEGEITRRQDKPKVYARNGPAVLVCHPDTLRSGKLYGASCAPYFMSEEDSLDIDTAQDLILAEQALLAREN